MSKSLRVFLTESVSRHSTDTLRLFLNHCISSMMNKVVKGATVFYKLNKFDACILLEIEAGIFQRNLLQIW